MPNCRRLIISPPRFPLAKVNPAATDVISDDQVLLCLQYSTQWDSLAHVGVLRHPMRRWRRPARRAIR